MPKLKVIFFIRVVMMIVLYYALYWTGQQIASFLPLALVYPFAMLWFMFCELLIRKTLGK